MNVGTILWTLEWYTGRFPREALEAAVARQEEITPHLLAILEEADVDWLAIDHTYMGHTYAYFLLAQFREERAYPLIVDFFSTPGDTVLDIHPDFVTEDLGRVLASVSGGDLGPMESLVKDPAVNEYVRAAALTGMLTLVVEGVRTREEVIAVFRGLFRGGLERSRSYAWDSLVGASSDLYPEELMPEIREAFAADLIDETFIDFAWCEEILAQGKAATLAQLGAVRHHHFVRDVVSEMEWWYCFQDPAPHQSTRKIGRNEPCPCGSGRKWKHCCGKRT